jgi:hypothetical protein
MADPVTIMLVASSAMQAVGAVQQGKMAAAQGKAQMEAANYNARMKEIEAGITREQSNAREEQQRRQARQLLGRQRAAVAQAGIGWGGSALDIMEESATLAELDALTIRYEGDLKARGLLAEAEFDKYSGQVAMAQGKAAKTASYISAAASLLSGAAGAYKGMGAGTTATAGGSGISATSSRTGFGATGSQGLRISGSSASSFGYTPSLQYGLR